jgi:hypothetical protein
VRFVTAVDVNGNPTAGVSVAAGGGSWSSLSDRNAKANFKPVDSEQILKRLALIPIATWNYKSQTPSIRHIGPIAQDFSAAFKVGEDDKHITTIDSEGVALAAIQGLYKMLQQKDAEIAALRTETAILKKRQTASAATVDEINMIEARLDSLARDDLRRASLS